MLPALQGRSGGIVLIWGHIVLVMAFVNVFAGARSVGGSCEPLHMFAGGLLIALDPLPTR